MIKSKLRMGAEGKVMAKSIYANVVLFSFILINNKIDLSEK